MGYSIGVFKELIEILTALVEKHGDQDVAIRTEEGTFAADGCYYDPIAESIIIEE